MSDGEWSATAGGQPSTERMRVRSTWRSMSSNSSRRQTRRLAASHTADTRHTEVRREQDALAQEVDALSDMMADIQVGRRRPAAAGHGERSGRILGRVTRRQRGPVDHGLTPMLRSCGSAPCRRSKQMHPNTPVSSRALCVWRGRALSDGARSIRTTSTSCSCGTTGIQAGRGRASWRKKSTPGRCYRRRC